MNKIDASLLNILVKDGRASYADIARQLGISRAHARTRVQALVDSGVIELFSAVVNPEELGKVISTFIDLKVVADHAGAFGTGEEQHCVGDIAWLSEPTGAMPALLTKMSNPVSVCTIRSTSATQPSSSATSSA